MIAPCRYDYEPTKLTPAELRVIEHGVVVECLIEMRDMISRSECALQVDKATEVESEDVRLDPEVQEACQYDISKFCMDVPAGQGRVHACLRSHLDELSDKCRESELEGEVRESLVRPTTAVVSS